MVKDNERLINISKLKATKETWQISEVDDFALSPESEKMFYKELIGTISILAINKSIY